MKDYNRISQSDRKEKKHFLLPETRKDFKRLMKTG